jgi:Ca2+-binding RTX toxin-like protein
MLTGSGVISGSVLNGGHASPGGVPAESPVGHIQIGADYAQTASGHLDIDIGGLTPATEYDQLHVVGGVTLSGTLSVNLLDFVPAIDDKFTIVENEGTDPITGMFNGLPDGDILRDTTGNYGFRITYRGLDGNDNDVVLTVIPINTPPVAVPPPPEDLIVTEDGTAEFVLSGSDAQTPESALEFRIWSVPQYGVLKDSAGNVLQANATFTGPPTLTYEPGAAWEGEGSDSFAFRVTDEGGLLSDLATVPLEIVKAVADGAVTIDDAGIVRIGGTEADDVILITHTADGQNLRVTINGMVTSDDIALSRVTEVRSWARAGNDRIELIDLVLASMLHGGYGDDRLIGGAAHDLIFGDLGNDDLTGAAGDDFLIGGAGADRIVGSAGHDILIAGDVAYRFTDEELGQISDDWAFGRIVDEGLDDHVLDETSIETGVDMLTGSSGADWFIVNQYDKITDFKEQKKDGDLVTQV